MRLDALIHLSRAVLAMAEVDQLVIFGSASLLGSFPELGDREDSPLQFTYDADLIPIPFEEEVGLMLDEAFGEDRAFHRRFGYHADIVRSKITETFPCGWEDRLIGIHEVPGAYCRIGHAGTVMVHNPGFVIDTDMLPVGASIMARIVERRMPLG